MIYLFAITCKETDESLGEEALWTGLLLEGTGYNSSLVLILLSYTCQGDSSANSHAYWR